VRGNHAVRRRGPVADPSVTSNGARKGGDDQVAINFLEKIQMATPAAAYGAPIAGVDYVLMGAGIRAKYRDCSTMAPASITSSLARRTPRRSPAFAHNANDRALTYLDAFRFAAVASASMNFDAMTCD
jgi:hypothetical protein